MLIGKGGETVKQLSMDSGCRIDVQKLPAAGDAMPDDGQENEVVWKAPEEFGSSAHNRIIPVRKPIEVLSSAKRIALIRFPFHFVAGHVVVSSMPPNAMNAAQRSGSSNN